MRTFTIIALLALFTIPAFAQVPSDMTIIDLTIEAYADVTIAEEAYSIVLDPGNNGGSDEDFVTVNYEVNCNYYHEISYDLDGYGAEWSIGDDYYEGYGPGGPLYGWVDVWAWADMSYEAGDYEATLTISSYEDAPL
jgi:hypothetical protein